jgi:hypothetical protein
VDKAVTLWRRKSVRRDYFDEEKEEGDFEL